MLTKIAPSGVLPLLDLGLYAAGDNMGGVCVFPVSSGAPAGSQSALTIRRIVIIDADVEDAELYLHLYNATPSAAAITDQAAHAPAAADLLLKLCTIHVAAADYLDSTGDSIVTNELDIPIIFDGLNLYGVLECVAGPTYTAATDLKLHLIVEA
jgi:hypothetical protein